MKGVEGMTRTLLHTMWMSVIRLQQDEAQVIHQVHQLVLLVPPL